MDGIDEKTIKVFQEVCFDSRITTKELAKKVGVSEVTARKRLEELESRYGLRYVVELNPQNVVYPDCYVICAKLKNLPDEKRLLKMLKNSPVPQFAALCEGEFNLFIYAAALSSVDYMRWQFAFRAEFENELVFWRSSNVILERQGAFPFRNELLKLLPLSKPEVALICALNENSRAPLTEIARSAGLTLSETQYHFKRLIETRIIKRMTAVIEKPPASYQFVNFLTYTYGKKHQQYSEKVRAFIESKTKPSLLGQFLSVIETTGGNDGVDLISESSVESGYKLLRQINVVYSGSLENSSGLISKILFGVPPYQNLAQQGVYADADWSKK